MDYVLKYAINDFDIEDFKSSNHLSMKQIRKDIMKKNSKLSGAGVSGDQAFYKVALNAAIDEFGSYIQENFIVINEFVARLEAEQQRARENESSSGGANREGTPESLGDEEALKLKEALEVARQNFYKGKVSMVCLTKKGGYVVKEVNDKEHEAVTVGSQEPLVWLDGAELVRRIQGKTI